MSRIQALLSDLCPQGVPLVALSAVAEYSTDRVDASELDASTFVGVDNLLPNKAGKLEASFRPNTTRLTNYRVGDTLLGNIRPYLKKVWFASNDGGCSGDVLAIRIRPSSIEVVDPEFLYFVLSSDDFFIFNTQHSKGGKMPRGSKAAIMSFDIPLPPMEIQREVARVLGSFRSLEVHLEEELDSRRKQYAFYRDAFFSEFDANTEWATLGDVASVRVGQAPPPGVVVESGPFPFINAGTGESGRATERNTPGGTVTIPSRGQGGVGVVGYQAKDFWCGPLCYRVESSTDRLFTRYLFFFLKSIQPAIRGLQQTGGTPALNKKELVLVEVPIPSLQEQERVVSLLNQFDELINDPLDGIPAEISARMQQFEYYRTRILSFEKVSA